MGDFKDILRDWKGRKVLMTIFPHPDDESMACGGLLLSAKKLGWKTIVVTLTKGGAGRLYLHGNGRSVAEIREEELNKAAKVLKVNELCVGDFSDAHLKETQNKWTGWVLALLKKYRPGIVVTYDHSGFTGHPDHIVLSVKLHKLIKETSPKIKLFWSANPHKIKKLISDAWISKYDSVPDYQLNLGWTWVRKWFAVRCHRSQNLGKSIALLLPIFLAFYHYEWYHKVSVGKRYKYEFKNFKI